VQKRVRIRDVRSVVGAAVVVSAVVVPIAVTVGLAASKTPFPIIVAPIAEPGWWLAALGVLELTLYALPVSMLAPHVGLRRCALLVLAAAAARLALAFWSVTGGGNIGSFFSNWFIRPPWWAVVALPWGRYTLYPAAHIAGLSAALAAYVSAALARQRLAQRGSFRLWLGPMLCCLCAVVLVTSFRKEVATYYDRDHREGLAAINLQRTRALVGAFFHETGAYPVGLEELGRPSRGEGAVGLDAGGRYVPLRGRWQGPDSVPLSFVQETVRKNRWLERYGSLDDPLMDGLASDGGPWAYETQPPHVGELHTRAKGRTLGWGIRYEDL